MNKAIAIITAVPFRIFFLYSIYFLSLKMKKKLILSFNNIK